MFLDLQVAFLCKLRADFAAAKPLGTKFERLFEAPLSNSFRAFSGTKPFSTEKLLARIRAVTVKSPTRKHRRAAILSSPAALF